MLSSVRGCGLALERASREVAVSSYGRADELVGQDHGGVGHVHAVVPDEKAEGELAVADHGGGDWE